MCSYRCFPATTLTPCCLPHAGGEADVTAWYESVKKRLEHDRYVASLTDSGAHLAIFQDGTGPTSTISFWGRDRKQGSGGWPLEFCVQKQARDTAYIFNLHDRGTPLLHPAPPHPYLRWARERPPHVVEAVCLTDFSAVGRQALSSRARRRT